MENEQKQSIKELAELLHDNNLGEIEYESNGVYIRIAAPSAHTGVMVAGSAPAPAVVEQKSLPVATETAAAKDATIDSPMVGVVYLTKDPNSPAFVKVGDTVSVGQTVCLIEAMKTFNPIKSTKAGKITAVLVESGSPVEYGQPLFSVA
ncbi:MAG: acetyl-CoA carboxylase biotin carboxyl carrier protein [Alphaproteobacteria bacterium]